MGRLGRNLSNEIKEFITQEIETRYSYNQSAMTYLPPGEDSVPIKDDRIVLVQVDGKGNFVAVGVLAVSQGAKAGEKILYSRNSDGEVQAAIKLLNDGKIEMVAPDAIKIEGEKEFAVSMKEKIEIKTEDEMNLEATETTVAGKTKLEINSADASIIGGKLTVSGSVAPTGSGPFCAITVCPYTGQPHVGNMVMGT